MLLGHTKAGEFLWQFQMDGLEIKPKLHPPSLKLQDGYYFSYDNKFRSLLNPPKPGQSKFDQVLEWAKEQANYK